MIQTDTKNATFTEQIDAWIIAAIGGGVSTFPGLVHSLPGVFPVDILDRVSRLAMAGIISREVSMRFQGSARSPSLPFHKVLRCTLPVPHALDFEWRFSLSARKRLAELCLSLGKRIVCLGTPSVFAELDRRAGSDRCAFVDRNSASLQAFSTMSSGRVIRCDCLRDPVPNIVGDVIVADPPWYTDFLDGFLWMAAQLCQVDGRVILSLPPEGTRPDAKAEVAHFLKRASGLGFRVEMLEENSLPYETPHFEENVFFRSGIHCDLSDWRRGSLAILKKTETRRGDRPLAPPEESWDEICLYGTRIKIRTSARDQGVNPALIPLIDRNVLGSVSRSDPLRCQARVWTSGNRVFGCECPILLFDLLNTMSPELKFRERPDHQRMRVRPRGPGLVHLAVGQIHHIASLEQRERQGVGCG